VRVRVRGEGEGVGRWDCLGRLRVPLGCAARGSAHVLRSVAVLGEGGDTEGLASTASQVEDAGTVGRDLEMLKAWLALLLKWRMLAQ